MGEAKRKRQARERAVWPHADHFGGTIDLHMLPPVATISGAYIRKLTGDDSIADTTQIILQAFRAVVSDRHSTLAFASATRRASARSALP